MNPIIQGSDSLPLVASSSVAIATPSSVENIHVVRRRHALAGLTIFSGLATVGMFVLFTRGNHKAGYTLGIAGALSSTLAALCHVYCDGK